MLAANRPFDELQAGDRFASYRIEATIGWGGSGIVYLARRDDGGAVALKVLRRAVAADPTSLERFRRESRSAAAIRHPHVVPQVDAGDVDGQPYLVSRYMAGGSLAARLLRSGPPDVDAGLTLIDQIADGLHALHQMGFVHRDVKAENILLEPDGVAALGDMGLARGPRDSTLTQTGQVMGTMDYLAPELIRGEAATPASDIYALGCVVFAALTGRLPFASASPFKTAFAHLEEAVPNPATLRPAIGPRLAAAMVTALAKVPEGRPATTLLYAQTIRLGRNADADRPDAG
jgi:serine/threonine protein kinase